MIAATARPVGVAVSIPSRMAQQDSALAKIRDGAGNFSNRSAEPIDSGYDDGVARPGIVEHRSQSRSRGFRRAGEFVGEHPLGVDTRWGERGQLCVEVLARGADSCVAEDRRHTEDCLIVHRQWGFETRAVRQDMRHRDLLLQTEGVAP